MATIHLLAGLLGYVITGRFVMRRLEGWLRELLFAGLNVAGVFFFLFYGGNEHYVLRFVIYLALIGGLYVVMRMFSRPARQLALAGFLCPHRGADSRSLCAGRMVCGPWATRSAKPGAACPT